MKSKTFFAGISVMAGLCAIVTPAGAAAPDAAVSRLSGASGTTLTDKDIQNAKPMFRAIPADKKAAMVKAAGSAASIQSVPQQSGVVAGNAGSPVVAPAVTGSAATEKAAAGTDGGTIQAYGTTKHPFTTMGAYSGTKTASTSSPTNLYPWRAAGKLYMKFSDGNSYVCSAAMIKRGLLVTAAHCVWNFGTNVQATAVTFVPAMFESSKPYGQYTLAYSGGRSGIFVPKVYTSGTDTCADDQGVSCANDVAVIALKAGSDGKHAGDKTGWFGYGYGSYGYSSFFGKQVAQLTQLGYPVTFSSGKRMIRTDSTGYQVSPTSVIIGSRQTGGSSGGPWILNFGVDPSTSAPTPSAGTANVVVGVTSWEYVDNNGNVTSDLEQGASRFSTNAAFQSTPNIKALVNAACSAFPSNC
ncbi:trypsin-like serine peptidase [Oryzibacter oryziterrae]|uniref:trypsin-like serine peptidase n=1 Tax=Oryzibacter oryziterrae TaxID=2766474 RepID=UPI001EFF6950|nr:trypsin-like serine protease [Oryzibacter oryziterrae]